MGTGWTEWVRSWGAGPAYWLIGFSTGLVLAMVGFEWLTRKVKAPGEWYCAQCDVYVRANRVMVQHTISTRTPSGLTVTDRVGVHVRCGGECAFHEAEEG